MSLSPYMPNYCTVKDCDCPDFREVRGDGQAGEAA
jgi:hypothetical protein